jgi:transcriptional regulator with XRE-family HTH domain
MKRVDDLHEEWMKSPEYRAEFDALQDEFAIARSLIEARTRAGLSQTEVAQRMQTSQSYVARLESGSVKPTTDALYRFARSTGSQLRITLEPILAKKPRTYKKTRASARRPAALKAAASRKRGQALKK